MQRVGEFEKVSIGQWMKDCGIADEKEAMAAYEEIKLPKRATRGSAGYDINLPFDIRLAPGESIKIPTGIRIRMNEDVFFLIAPRSGLGSRFRLQLNNTVGIIDSDYYNSSNEGHLFVPMMNDSREGKVLELSAGSAFAQGIFLGYGISFSDDAGAERDGGFGSTD